MSAAMILFMRVKFKLFPAFMPHANRKRQCQSRTQKNGQWNTPLPVDEMKGKSLILPK
jgi:hypothetical protein